MIRVINCLETQHDLWLVALAASVCFLTSLAAVNLFHRARVADGNAKAIWLLITGTLTGSGVWATHFIAMLAYTPGFPIRYAIPTTIVSLLVATIMTTTGFATAVFGSRRTGSIAGGMLVGAGVAAMHYLGMASLRIPAEIIWMPDLVIASILLGMILGAASLFVATSGESTHISALAAGTLTLAITSHHFVAMGAMGIIPQPASSYDGNLLSPVALATSIAGIAATLVIGGLIGAILDRKASRSIAIRNMQLDAALNNMGQGLCMFGADGRLQLWNESYLNMYRIPPGKVAAGISIEQLYELRRAAGTIFRELNEHSSALQNSIENRAPMNRTSDLVDGRTVDVTYQPMQNGGWVIRHEDITERRQNEARISYLALHDPLTGLPNRSAFNESFAQYLSEESMLKTPFALIRINIDGFKEINDEFGQVAGDAVLFRLAGKLKASCNGDFLARTGGDEFTMLIRVADDITAETICDRLSTVMDQYFEVDGQIIRTRCTAGMSMCPQDGRDAQALVSHADTALSRAKAEERGAVRLFEPTMDQQIREKRLLHRDLIEALEHNQFDVYFQPQATSDGKVAGFEALVRWQHPKRGTVSPGAFIPHAEETGLISAIDQWVLREACREAASWKNPLSISVNLSPVDFQRGDISSIILGILLETGLEPHRLEIEITEGVLIDDFSRAVMLLRKIKDLGVRIAMDDFGTGYSSLSYLQSFPFDKIKIDQSFVGQLGKNVQSAAIIKAILVLGRTLELPVIAEGVETSEQLDFLVREGCSELQGFLIGRPQKISHYQDAVGNPGRLAVAS